MSREAFAPRPTPNITISVVDPLSKTSARTRDVGNRIWDFVQAILFDRTTSHFGTLTILILLIDGFSRKRPIAMLLIMHTVLRALGGIVLLSFKQTTLDRVFQDRLIDTCSTPFYIIGELCLDIYPFLKAWVVSSNSKLLKAICVTAFAPLLFSKLGMLFYKCIGRWMLYEEEYWLIFNLLDAIIITITAWNDILCCGVIVYVSHVSKKFVRRSGLLEALAKQTEIRMVIATVCSIIACTLILVDGCRGNPYTTSCAYNSARDLTYITTFTFYYLDYMMIKVRMLQMPIMSTVGNAANTKTLDRSLDM